MYADHVILALSNLLKQILLNYSNNGKLNSMQNWEVLGKYEFHDYNGSKNWERTSNRNSVKFIQECGFTSDHDITIDSALDMI